MNKNLLSQTFPELALSYVYIAICRDGTFYTGYTTNLSRRLHAHNNQTSGARYTRSRQPVFLVYARPCLSKSEALKQEAAIKKLKRSEKLALITASTWSLCTDRQWFIPSFSPFPEKRC